MPQNIEHYVLTPVSVGLNNELQKIRKKKKKLFGPNYKKENSTAVLKQVQLG
jgi:hypothetical protein